MRDHHDVSQRACAARIISPSLIFGVALAWGRLLLAGRSEAIRQCHGHQGTRAGRRKRTPRRLTFGRRPPRSSPDRERRVHLAQRRITDSATFLRSSILRGMLDRQREPRAVGRLDKWQFRVIAGSAPDVDHGLVRPMPASDSAAATLTLTGNRRGFAGGAAEHQLRGVQALNRDVVFDQMRRATRPIGGFASSSSLNRFCLGCGCDRIEAKTARVGTRMRPPWAPREFDQVRAAAAARLRQHHHLLAGPSIGRQIFFRARPARIPPRGQRVSGNSSSTTGQSMFCSFSQSAPCRHCRWRWRQGANPGRPSVSRRATAADGTQPAMAMRVEMSWNLRLSSYVAWRGATSRIGS